MKILLWLRAARFLNWFNWNHNIPGTYSFVLQEVKAVKNFEVGMTLTVQSVHRTTGKVCMAVE